MNKQLLINNACAEIAKLIQQNIDGWVRAGKIVAQLLDDGATLDTIVESINVRHIKRDLIAALERVGREQCLPELLIADYPAANPMQLLPLSEQKRCTDGTIEMLVMNDGMADTLQVSARDLTKEQCKQVFAKGSIRTLGEQRLWMQQRQQQEAQLAAKTITPPYIIRNHKVVFTAGAEFNRRDLAILLSQLE